MEKMKVEIWGNQNENILSITLKDILSCINNINYYHWKILWFRGIGNIGMSILDFENEINNSANGKLFSLVELLQLSDSLTQILEITLIGSPDLSKLKRYNQDEQMYRKCSYTIELIDSSYWELICYDQKTINTIKQKFDLVKSL